VVKGGARAFYCCSCPIFGLAARSLYYRHTWGNFGLHFGLSILYSVNRQNRLEEMMNLFEKTINLKLEGTLPE
jgi:hypothetical protein